MTWAWIDFKIELVIVELRAVCKTFLHQHVSENKAKKCGNKTFGSVTNFNLGHISAPG